MTATAPAPQEKTPRRSKLQGAALVAGYWTLLAIATHVPMQPARRIPHLDKVAHAAAYAGLTLALLVAWELIATIRRRTYAVVLLVVGLYAIADECLQGFVPHRQPDWQDGVADLTGAFTAAALFAYWRGRRATPSTSSG